MDAITSCGFQNAGAQSGEVQLQALKLSELP